MYILVYCDYEGLSSLQYVGTTPSEAATAIQAARASYNPAPEHLTVDEIIDSGIVYDEREPDRWCVMSPDESNHFQCVCKSLGLAPSKLILY